MGAGPSSESESQAEAEEQKSQDFLDQGNKHAYHVLRV